MKRIIIGLLASYALTGQLEARCKTHKICAADIPKRITKPGKYILCEDVTYNFSPTDTVGAAIKIECSDVKLCLFAHTITVVDNGTPQAKGIWVNNPNETLYEIDINNDAIKGTGLAGIYIENASKVRLDNMYTIGLGYGLRIDSSSDVIVQNSEFSHAGFSGCFAFSSNSVTLRDSVFKDNVVGINLNTCNDTKILTCSFLNSVVNNLLTGTTDGLLVKNSSFSQTQVSLADLVMLGVAHFTLPSNSTRFEGCTFISSFSQGHGVNFNLGDGLVIDSCLFDLSNARGDTNQYANLLLGSASSNTLVTGSIFQGTSDGKRIGIDVEGPNALIERSLIDGLDTGVKLNSSGATVSSSRIVSCKDSNMTGIGVDILGLSNSVEGCSLIQNDRGVILEPTSQYNTVTGNTVAQSTADGIDLFGDGINMIFPHSNTISNNDLLGNTSNGIFLDVGCVNNTVQRNRAVSNGGEGIQNAADTSNKFYFNTANNNAPDYSPTIPTQKHPGDKTLEGSNILPA